MRRRRAVERDGDLEVRPRVGEERRELDRQRQRAVVRRGERQHDDGLAAAGPGAVEVGRPPARAKVARAGLGVLEAQRAAWPDRDGGLRRRIGRRRRRAAGSRATARAAAGRARAGAPTSPSATTRRVAATAARRADLAPHPARQLVADALDRGRRQWPVTVGLLRAACARAWCSAEADRVGHGLLGHVGEHGERLAQLSREAVAPRLLGHALPVEAGRVSRSSAASAAQRSSWVSVQRVSLFWDCKSNREFTICKKDFS